MTDSPQSKGSSALLIAALAALVAVGALGWTAAEGGRGLNNADLRTVIVVSVGVFVAAWFTTRDRGS
jgi:hypothetical protein